MRVLLLFLVIGCIFLPSCRPDAIPYTHLEGKAQGTTFSIIYRDSLQRDFAGSVDSIFRLIDRSMSLWDSTSLISRVNRNETDTIPDPHFTTVFNTAQQIAELTHGAFDVTVGPLIRAWGFSAKKNNAIPDSAAIDSLMPLVGYTQVRIENGLLKKEDPRIQLDFNAIAQGYTVDVIARFLTEKGSKHFLVEIGGEVRAMGLNERREAWQIGIDKPVEANDGERPLQTIIPIENKSLATSGSYRKFIRQGEKKLSHIIDPATGYPVQHPLISASVLAADCATADALATAFLVLGMEKSLDLAQHLKVEIYCIYQEAGGELKTAATPGFPQ